MLIQVPLSFPPALSDIDRQLQRAHCYLALGAPDRIAKLKNKDMTAEQMAQNWTSPYTYRCKVYQQKSFRQVWADGHNGRSDFKNHR